MIAFRVGLILICIATMAPSAAAEDKAAARQAYAEGSKYYDLGQYTEALEAFKRAYWNYETPPFLYNMAQCHRALGHKREAIELYRSYLRKASDAPNREEVQRIVAELNAALEKEKNTSPTSPSKTVATANKPTSGDSQTRAVPVVGTTVAASAPPEKKPVWERGWVWGIVGGVVAAGVAVGVGVGVGLQPHPPTATDGMAHF